jgi:hypothetical protein
MFRRAPKMMMHHSHKLEVKQTHSLSNKRIYEEVKTYVNCNIPKTQIHSILIEKYKLPVSFSQVMRLCC